MKALDFALTLSICAFGASAWAQDSDGDGHDDAADAVPCDASTAGLLFAPSETAWTTLAFEDQWPQSTDLDYNDVVVRTNYRLEVDGNGLVHRLVGTFDAIALGGTFDNGLGLQLPVSKLGATVRRRVGQGAWTSLTPRTDSQLTVVLSDNLRELFGGASGQINSDASQPVLTGEVLQVEVVFATPVALNAGAAPFDVFVFRSRGDIGHQIHLVQHSGTAEMDTALFGGPGDGSNAAIGRYFVHPSGTPFALNLAGTTRYPLEGVAVDLLFPDIVGFANSAGAQNADFYLTNVDTAQGWSAPSSTPPSVSIDSSCTIDSDGDSLTDGEEALAGSDPNDPSDPAPPHPTLIAANDTTCLLDVAGKLECWGNDNFGLISQMPGSVAFTNFSPGGSHACGVDVAGAIHCWGDDTYGQVSGAPSGVWTQVASGAYHSCAIDVGGSIYCWGLDNRRQVSGAPTSAGWLEIASGWTSSCAIDAAGNVLCWGNSAPVSGGPYSEFDMGTQHFCGIQADRRIGCRAGPYAPSELGSGRGAANWVDVVAGDYHTCALLDTGTIQCWGVDYWGYGTLTDYPTTGGWVQLVAGSNHSCALDSSGSVSCWGSNSHGQASPPSGVAPVDVGAGTWGACSIDTRGKLDCWGMGDLSALAPADGTWTAVGAGQGYGCGIDAGRLRCWGSGTYGQVTDVPQTGQWSKLAVSDYLACAIDTSGSMQCWGYAPTVTGGLWADVTTGYYHACGIDQGGNLHCWGDVGSAPTSSGWKAVSGGYAFGCGIDAGDQIQCWGLDTANQLQAPAGSWTQIASGVEGSCALDAAGAMQCWGSGRIVSKAPAGGVWTELHGNGAGDNMCAVNALGYTRCWGQVVNTLTF